MNPDTTPTYKYGDKVVDAAGREGIARFNDKTGEALSPIPAPSTTPVTSEYYSRKDALSKIALDPGRAPDLGQIRNELTTNNQALIDSIKAQYAGTIAQEQARGEVMNKRQRGVNVASGLAGSDFAGSNAQKVEDSTLAAVRAIESERDQKIAATLAGVAFRATEMYEEQKNAYRKKAEDSIQTMAQFKEQAMGDISNFAASGLSASQLKEQSPETWRALIEQTGYDEAGLTAAFIANKPDPDFKEKIGNSLVYGYRDPQTGKITTEKVELPSGYDSFERVGDKYAFIDTASGTFKYAEGMTAATSSSSNSAGKGYKDGQLSLTGAQLNAVEQELQNSKTLYSGDGKYVNPQVYEATLKEWIDLGGTQQGFLTKFPPNRYVNPENKELPIYLQNTTGRAAEKAANPPSKTIVNPFAQ